MSININAAKKAEIDAKRDKTVERNGAALDERQKKSAMGEVAALAKGGDYEAAILKIAEIIDS